jgi:hypothetical protein
MDGGLSLTLSLCHLCILCAEWGPSLRAIMRRCLTLITTYLEVRFR